MSDSKELRCKIIAGKVNIRNTEEFLSSLRFFSQKYGVIIQALDAEKIAGEEHIREAVKKAIRAMERGRNITSDLGLELLLYVSGRGQIERALEVGVSEGEKKVAIVIVGHDNLNTLEEVKKEVKIEEEPMFLELDEGKKKKIKKFFDITEEEIKAVGEKKLKKLVLERVAMLDVQK